MKVTVPGDTPMERLTNFTKRIIDIPKADIDRKLKRHIARKRRKIRKAKR